MEDGVRTHKIQTAMYMATTGVEWVALVSGDALFGGMVQDGVSITNGQVHFGVLAGAGVILSTVILAWVTLVLTVDTIIILTMHFMVTVITATPTQEEEGIPTYIIVRTR